MELRKVRDEEDARTCLVAVAASGLSRRAWARQHGIDPRSLNAWQQNLERRHDRVGEAPLQLVEVAELRPACASYVVSVRDYRIDVGDDFRDDTLRRLVGVLRTC